MDGHAASSGHRPVVTSLVRVINDTAVVVRWCLLGWGFLLGGVYRAFGVKCRSILILLMFDCLELITPTLIVCVLRKNSTLRTLNSLAVFEL